MKIEDTDEDCNYRSQSKQQPSNQRRKQIHKFLTQGENKMRKIKSLNTVDKIFDYQANNLFRLIKIGRIYFAFFVVLTITISSGGVSAQEVVSQDSKILQNRHDNSQMLSGSWIVDVIPTPGPGSLPPVKTFNTYDSGGGLVFTGILPPFGYTAHGTWVRTGSREFAFTAVAPLFGQNGQLSGTFKAREKIKLNLPGDEYTGEFVADFFDVSGNFLFSLTGTVHAKRIRVETF